MQQSPRHLEVCSDEAVYEIEFTQIQIEITGRCNLRCRHCRASNQAQSDMPIEQIEKIALFAAAHGSREVVVSGGEPLLHREFPAVLRRIKSAGMSYLTLTTNGYLLSKERLRTIMDSGFTGTTLSVSIDSHDPAYHDMIRGRVGAFDRAVAALRVIDESHGGCVVGSVRATVGPEQIDDMDRLVECVVSLGCRRVGFSSVLPAGRALGLVSLSMTKTQKRRFLEKIEVLSARFPDVDIGTNDPLACLVSPRTADPVTSGELVFNGCGAAATTFNVNADGTMTPCAMLDLPIMNVFPLSVSEIADRYSESQIVKDMLGLRLKGKCGSCGKKYQCGGCRARAFAASGDHLSEDPDCWL
jgi:radical SAM protein with 4Fe4S-binding SPASM domain